MGNSISEGDGRTRTNRFEKINFPEDLSMKIRSKWKIGFCEKLQIYIRSAAIEETRGYWSRTTFRSKGFWWIRKCSVCLEGVNYLARWRLFINWMEKILTICFHLNIVLGRANNLFGGKCCEYIGIWMNRLYCWLICKTNVKEKVYV